MTTDDLTFNDFDITQLHQQILLEEVTKTTFTNETNTNKILLLHHNQLVFFNNNTYLQLFQLTNQKQNLNNLLTTDNMQKVTLILVQIQTLKQLSTTLEITTTHIITNNNQINTKQQTYRDWETDRKSVV